MGTATQPTRNVAFTATDNGVSFFLDGKSYVVNREHPGYTQIIEALQKQDYDAIPALMDVNSAMSTFLNTTDPDFEVKGALVYYKGKPFTEEVSEKVLRMTDKGVPALPLINFLKKVRKNISATAQRELLLFAAANQFLIHEDGDIIAYKAVREDYLDVHSGTVLNKPYTLMTFEEKSRLPYTTDRGVTVGVDNGTTVVFMERSDVDDRRDHTCSFGLHFAAHNYARSFTGGGRMLILKINPADVVAIPSDYGNAKGRCSRYEVMAEIEEEHIKETGLDHQEVYDDDDFRREGIHYGCGGSGIDDEEDGFDSFDDDEDEEDNHEEEFDDPADLSREEVIDVVAEAIASESPSHYIEDVKNSPDLSLDGVGLGSDNLEDLENFLREEYGDAANRATINPDSTLNSIVRQLRQEVDVERLKSVLNDKIMRRVVTDRISFLRAVSEQGYDANNERVSKLLQDAGYGAWL